jgi:hypothetical protein
MDATDHDARLNPRIRSPGRCRSLSASLIAAVAHLLFFTGPPARAETVDAIWKTHRVTFRYSSSTTAYSCGGLGTKLAAILRLVGAHQDMRVVASSCDEVAGHQTFDMLFRAPVPATEANLREATDYDTREQLAARLRGERLATIEDVERFPAEWHTISLHRDRKVRLAPSDCDLLRQVMRGFLSRMSVDTSGRSVRCSSSLGNFHPPILTVTALVRASGDGNL